MEQKVKENIKLLIKDGEKFERINISILFSYKRNLFFSHLSNYINFYNGLKGKLKNHNLNNDSKSEIIQKIPDLHFEDYSLWSVTQFVLIFSLPISFVIFFLQWNYIKEIKNKLKQGLIGFEQLLKE